MLRIRLYLIRCLYLGALCAVTSLGGCGRHSNIGPALQPAADAVAERPLAAGMSLSEMLNAVRAAQLPPGVSPATFAQLQDELVRLLRARGASKLAAAPPAGASNAVTDLLVAGSDSEGWRVEWGYRNLGDYNQDGLVSIAELTPIGMYFNAAAGSAGWAAARLADGDGNGEVNIADITPVGQNFLSYCAGYHIYGGDSAEGPWTLVGEAALPAAAAGEPLRLSFALPSLDYALYRVQPVDDAGAEGEPSWVSAAPGALAQVSLGADTMLVSQTIGHDGGELAGPGGSPLEGVNVSFPPGALPDGTSVELGYNDGSITPADGVFHGPILELRAAGVDEFDYPAVISVAFTPTAGYLPVPYDIDADGRLHALEISDLDPVEGSITFYTYHASGKATIDAKTDFAEIDEIGAYACSFIPNEDGFQIANNGSTFSPDGECFGMSSFAQWFYNTQRVSRGGLYPQFMFNVEGLSGQDLIATRAHLSIHSQFATSYRDQAVQRICNLSHSQNFGLLRGALLESQAPVLACLATPGQIASHSVLLLGYRPWQPYQDEPPQPVMLLSLYDPNWPGQVGSMYYLRPEGVTDWSSAQYQPYRRFGLPEMKTLVVEGDGALVVNEPYANILADADEQFNSSRNAQITVTSPAADSILYVRQAVLSGTIQSGEVLVEYLAAIVNGTGDFACEVAPTGEFSLAVPVFPGANKISLITGGNDAQDDALIVPNNMPNGFNLVGGYEGCAIVVNLLMDRQLNAESCLDLWVIDPTGDYSQWFYRPMTNDGGEMTTGLIFDVLQYTQTWTLKYADTVRWGEPYRVRAFWMMNRQGTGSIDSADYQVIVHANEGWPSQFCQSYSGTIAETYPDFYVEPSPLDSGPWWADVCTMIPVQATGGSSSCSQVREVTGADGVPVLYVPLEIPPRGT